MAEVVGGRVGQVLDLADHVVAEVADQAGVEGREVGEVGGVEGVEDGLEGGQDPAVPLTRPPVMASRSTGPVGGHLRAAGGDGGQRVAADERVAAPPLAALHRLEEEPGPVGTVDDLEEGGHRGEGVGHQLAPDRHDAVLGGQGREPVGPGPDGPAGGRRPGHGHCGSPKARKKQERLPVWQAPAPSWSTTTSSTSPSQS